MRRTRTTVACLAVFGALLALPASASAVLGCTFVGGALTVTRSGAGIDEVTFRVVGSAIRAFNGDGVEILCPGAPTVNNTASVTYSHTDGISDVNIEDPDRFAPGIGGPAEGAGAPEIEIAATGTGGILSDVLLLDTDGSGQSYVMGAAGVNLNPEEPAQDVDITASGFAVRIGPVGGPGPDRFDLRGGAGTGGPYDDVFSLAGAGGNDQLFAGSSTFQLDGGPGDDLLDGSATDSAQVVYAESTAPVSIDLTSSAPQNGGSLGRDTLVALNGVEGTRFNDVLRGSAAEEEISGGGGDDVIEGRGGDDDLDGGGGIDVASYESAPAPVNVNLEEEASQETGGAGRDNLRDGDLENVVGSAFNDTLTGTAGVNRMDGRGGRDTVRSLGGDDVVVARDGVGDVVDCGTGADQGVFDQPGLDSVTACESASFLDIFVQAALGGAKRQKLGKRGIAVSLRCPQEACTARLTAKAKIRGTRKAVALKGVRASLTAGNAKTLRLGIGKAARRRIAKALRGGKKVTVVVTATVGDAAGNRVVLRRTVTLKPAKKPAKKPARRG